MKEVFYTRIVLMVLEPTGVISSEMSCLLSIIIDSYEENFNNSDELKIYVINTLEFLLNYYVTVYQIN